MEKHVLFVAIALLILVVESRAQAPTLDTHLAYIQTVEGMTEVIGTTAHGTSPLLYEWRKDGTIILGANTGYYTIENATLSDAGVYTLTVSNSLGTVSSDIVVNVLENTAPAAHIQQPSPGTTFTPGGQVSFSGFGLDPQTGDVPSWTHVWRMDYYEGGEIVPELALEPQDVQETGENQTSGYFIIPHELIPTPGSFYRLSLTVADHLGLTGTSYVDLAWSGLLNQYPPIIDDDPQDATVNEGSPVTFSVVATRATSYQWQFNGTDIPGATSSTYYIEHVEADQAGTYRVLVSNSVGTTPSADAQLTVITNTPPVISDQPDGLTIAEGLSVNFTVTAANAKSYQWQFNEMNIPGATSSTYHIDQVQFEQAGSYSVQVSNDYGTTSSSAAILTVVANTPPSAYIVNPQPGQTYHPLWTIQFEGFGIDTDQESPPSQTWTVELLRDGQVLPGPPVVIQSQQAHTYGYFNIPDADQLKPNDIFRLRLTVQDIQGLTGTSYVDILRATTSVIALRTNPAKLAVIVDGQTVSTPYFATTTIGAQRTIAPAPPQTANGITYAFSNWAHGGPPEQTVKALEINTAYTINYSSPLAGPWRTTEVGAVNIHGSAFINNGTYTLSGSGNDIWGTADAFRFIYQSVYGDVDIRARVTGITNTDSWAKAGVMIRNSTDRSAKHAMTVITPGNGASFQRRLEPKGASIATNTPAHAPYWVRMVRNGDTFTSYISSDGTTWTMVGTPATIPMYTRVYVGLVVTSHSSNALCTATITDVSVTYPSTAASSNNAVVVDVESQTFDVYPNPVVGDNLHIKLITEKATGVQIINLLGQVLYEGTAPAGPSSNTMEVDVSAFPKGVYIVRASNNLHIRTMSFIKP
jgi:regulation of enolase protein 1 (concanavalin A-like superfamily)